MNFDFPALLVGATLFTGLAWAFDAWLLAPGRRRKASALLGQGMAAESEPVLKALKESTWSNIANHSFPLFWRCCCCAHFWWSRFVSPRIQ